MQFVKNCCLSLLWVISGVRKRDSNTWIFTSWSGENYSDNSRVFYEWIRKNHSEIKCFWLLKNDSLIKALNDKKIHAVNSESKEGKRLLSIAGKIFTVRDDEFSFFRINGAEWYQLWHGMPLKKIKSDYLDGIKTISKKSIVASRILEFVMPWGVNRYRKRFTCTNSSFFIPYLSSSFNLSADRILTCGTPRCDALFYCNEEHILKRLSEKYENCRFILYMPTCRTSQWDGKYFEPFAEQYGFNFSELNEVLEKRNFVFLYKPHFYEERVLNLKKVSERFVTITNDDIGELYNFCGQIDILITDYSSIYFDFIVTRKPVILMPFDYEEYLRTSRNHYFDYFTQMAGIKALNWHEALKILDDESYRPVTEDKIKQFAEFVDGKSCEKLYECIIKGDCQ